MGTLIRFPEERRAPRSGEVVPSELGSIVILPVVRIERHQDDVMAKAAPASNTPPRSRRGRRS
jgi:hypothetical protein